MLGSEASLPERPHMLICYWLPSGTDTPLHAAQQVQAYYLPPSGNLVTLASANT